VRSLFPSAALGAQGSTISLKIGQSRTLALTLPGKRLAGITLALDRRAAAIGRNRDGPTGGTQWYVTLAQNNGGRSNCSPPHLRPLLQAAEQNILDKI